MALATWWSGDPLPALALLPDFRAAITADGGALARTSRELCAAWQAAERFAAWLVGLGDWPEQPPWFRGDHPGVLVRVRWRGGAGGQIEILLPGRIGPIAGADIATAVCPLLTPLAEAAWLWRSEKSAAWSTAGHSLAAPGETAPGVDWRAEHIATILGVCYVVYATDGRARKIVVVNDASGPTLEIAPGHVLDIAPREVPRGAPPTVR